MTLELNLKNKNPYIMKKSRLKEIIREELEKTLNEVHLGDELYPEDVEEANGEEITKLLTPYKDKIVDKLDMEPRHFDMGVSEYIMDFEPESIKNKRDLVRDFIDYLGAMGY